VESLDIGYRDAYPIVKRIKKDLNIEVTSAGVMIYDGDL
jgi:hypothetical protein